MKIVDPSIMNLAVLENDISRYNIFRTAFMFQA